MKVFPACAGGLVVDNEEIAVWPIDVTEPQLDSRVMVSTEKGNEMTTVRSYGRSMTGVSLLGLLVAVGWSQRPQAPTNAWPKSSPTSTLPRSPTPFP